MTRQAVVVTVSDSVAAGARTDESGPAVGARLAALGFVCRSVVVPDEYDRIRGCLVQLAEDPGIAAIFTTGGTGIAPRDVTPEATRSVLDRELPGIGEFMRAKGLESTARAILSRAIAGARGTTLIVNLPGSPRGAVESFDAIAALIPHVLDLLEGKTDHGGGAETPAARGTSQH